MYLKTLKGCKIGVFEIGGWVMVKSLSFYLSKMNRPSKSKVKRAGKLLSNGDKSMIDVISDWRLLHSYPLNTFNNTLVRRIKKLEIDDFIVAQRLKRIGTIENKLKRFEGMSLDRMQDFGGLRAILPNVNDVEAVKNLYINHRSLAFKHELIKVHDYIETPQNSGYRGIHLIYKTHYDKKPEFSSLLLELQIRTKMQHIWATGVETMSIYIQQGLKFGDGDDIWKDFFRYFSSYIALLEKQKTCDAHAHLTLDDIKEKIKEIDKEVGLVDRVASVAIATQEMIEGAGSKKYCAIVLNFEERTMFFKYASEKGLISLNEFCLTEDAKESQNAVLISLSDTKKIKNAYPNYFMDMGSFVNILSRILDN